MIIEGLKLTLRNAGIIVFPIISILVLYFFIAGALITSVPISKINKINESSKNFTAYVQKVEKKIYNYVEKNFKKVALTFILFGIFAFIFSEFFNASMIVAARDIVFTGKFSFKEAFDGGFVYTLPLIGVDILCGFGFIAFLMPFYVAYILTRSKIILNALPVVLIFVAPFLITPRYVVVVKNKSVLDSIVDGVKIAIRNYLLAFTSVVFCSIISMISILIPIIYPIVSAFSASLLSVYMCLIVGGENVESLR